MIIIIFQNCQCIKSRCNFDMLSHFVSFSHENGDGEVSKAELKLAHKQLTMQQIEEIMRQIDEDHDGRMSLEEFNSTTA